MRKIITTAILVFFISACLSAQEIFLFKDDAGKYGYCDVSGKIIVQPNYSFARDFSEDLAYVCTGSDEYGGGGVAGYIDRTGKEVIPVTLICNYGGDFTEGFAFIEYKDFSIGFIDKAGKELSPKRYSSVNNFADGMAAVNIGFNGDENGLWGFIDKTGAEIIPLKYYDVYGFAEGLAPVNFEGKWGYVDKTGKMAIALKYNYAYGFAEGLAPVFLDKNFSGSMDEEKENTWGFIDKAGKEVTSFKFSLTGEIKCGRARVKQNGKWGYIDNTGNTVIDIKYPEAADFYEDLAWVSTDNQTVGFISKGGKMVIPAHYSYISGEGFSEGLVAVNRDEMYGYIDKTGKTVIPFLYSRAEPFKFGRAVVTLNDGELIIDKKGRQVIPHQ